ncbi:LptA/OstA family protein [Methylobacterium sp. J-068]|uniref:LptA/OstA family protein n=1 Tax=Methylobacterium sp. J-068 TaxID=2836649 RepID=UPI001FBA7C5A|nr:LptA/OstA family protein [Methylobacterium sp. J-068]MCJ2034109.1 organic solvent tolerance protein OstA [Methylobacterium sp. J-068]
MSRFVTRACLGLAGLALACLLAPAAEAQVGPAVAPRKEKAASGLGNLGGGGKEPIKIDADRLDVFDRENKAIFAGNVVAVQGDSTIRCSSMTVRYKRGKDKKETAEGAETASQAERAAGLSENGIQRVECAGPVTVVQKDQVATGDNAVFDQEAKRIVVTGNVVLSQCQNVTRGSRLVYDMNTGRANMDPVAGGRVSALFVPQKEDGAKGKGCAQPPAAARAAAKPNPDKANPDKPPADKIRAQTN